MTAQTVAPWTRSATELAAGIRDGDATSRAVVESFLERIAEVNPTVNAATVVFADRALAEADTADARLAAGDAVGPLHGVPFSVKENVDLTWSATTNGLALLADAVPPVDAVGVQRLRAAGAVPLIRTNMPDLGMRWHTDNDLFGATVNPWNPDRTPGGSSGGEGAAIATGMSPFGVGNDFAGSVRLPAHANGVCGLKPTPGRIPVWSPMPGVFPASAQMFAVEGPLGRSVDDVALAYELMQGPHEIDTATVPAVRDPYADAPQRAAVVVDPDGGGTAASVRAAVLRAADALAAAGWEVEQVEPPDVGDATRLWREMAVADLATFLFAESTGLVQHCSQGTRDHAAQLIEHTRHYELRDYGAAMSRRLEIRSAWNVFQRRYPLIVAPVTTDLPFRVGQDVAGADAVDELVHAHRMLVSVSCLGLPSLALPVGTTTEGMPDGVQLIGPFFGEQLCLRAGRDVEQACGRMVPIDPRGPEVTR